MTIWIFAILLIASTTGLAWKFGGIRAAFAFTGILFGTLLANVLAPLLRPLLSLAGVKNPVTLWVLGPIISFIIIVVIFKIAGMAIHRKVEVFYKYHAGNLRLALWERLNSRLGICIGVLNGAAYVILCSFLIYNTSYWTYQMSNPDSDPWTLRMLNRLGGDIQRTGFHTAASAVSRLPAAFYEAADTAGLIYKTPDLEARLARYPAFLSISEKPEIEALGTDEFSESLRQQPSLSTLLKTHQMTAIIQNPELLREIWTAAKPNTADLLTFLNSGRSATFENERILGRWTFDVNGAVALNRRLRPNMTTTEAQRLRRSLLTTYTRTYLVAAPDQTVLIKNYPRVRVVQGAAPTVEMENYQGKWQAAGDRYTVTLTVGEREEQATAELEGNRLLLPAESLGALAFLRED